VAIAQQAADHIRAHSTKTNHAELHGKLLRLQNQTVLKAIALLLALPQARSKSLTPTRHG
jgi:hypothetical protein